MKKQILILMLAAFGMMVQGQTTNVPIVLSEDIVVEPGDTIKRTASIMVMQMDDLKIHFKFAIREYRNGVINPKMSYSPSVELYLDSTYTFVHNGSTFTNTGKWFQNQVCPINTDLLISLGSNLYQQEIDPDGVFIKPD